MVGLFSRWVVRAGRYELAILPLVAVGSAVTLLYLSLIVDALGGPDGGGNDGVIALSIVSLAITVMAYVIAAVKILGIISAGESRNAGLLCSFGLSKRRAVLLFAGLNMILCLLGLLIGSLVGALGYRWVANVVQDDVVPGSALSGSIDGTPVYVNFIVSAVVLLLIALGVRAKSLSGELHYILQGLQRYVNRHTAGFVVRRLLVWVVCFGLLIFCAWLLGLSAPIGEAKAAGDFATTYLGVGLLGCLLTVGVASDCVYLAARFSAFLFGRGRASWLVGARSADELEYSAALTMPAIVTAVLIGVIVGWLHKLSDILGGYGQAGSISAPPEQMAYLLAGVIAVAVATSVSVDVASIPKRVSDEVLLRAFGVARGGVARIYALTYFLLWIASSVIAYCAVFVVEAVMVLAFRLGAFPEASISPPNALSFVVCGVFFILLFALNLVHAWYGNRRYASAFRG